MVQSKALATHANTLMNLQELKDLIVHNLDVSEFFDILGIELTECIDKFDEEIEENFTSLVKAVA
jgi:hypothetical protein